METKSTKPKSRTPKSVGAAPIASPVIMAPVIAEIQEIPAASLPVAQPPKSQPVEADASAVGQPMETIMTFTKEQMEKTAAAAKDQFEKVTTVARKNYDEMAVFGKANVDAVVKAGAIYAKGVEEFSRAVMGLSQIHYETTMTTAKAVMGATSLRQVIDLQSEFAKTAVDKTLVETTKLSELARKVATETMEPIQARVTVAVEKMGKPLAA